MKKSVIEIMCRDADVKRWHDNLARSSRLTANVRVRRLETFQRRTGVSPAELARIGKEDPMKAENMLLDYVSWMESRGYAPGYIEDFVKALKSWLSYNYVDIRRKIKIRDSRIPVTLQDEQVPTNVQLESIMNAADPRTRASMSLMALSGLRPKVIGNDNGTDGLRISDLPDLDVGDGTTVSFSRTPAMIVVRPQLSKAGHRYFTFLTEQGCAYLLGYLRGRIARGERLGPQSPLLAKHSDGGNPRPAPFIITATITSHIRKAIWSVLKARPYALRAYFDTQLLMAESNGVMTHAYRQFFMGHTGDMEARYTTNKGRLTEQMTEDMRSSFARSETFLDAGEKRDPQHGRQAFLDAWKSQARAYGIDPSQVSITINGEGDVGASPAPPAAEPEPGISGTSQPKPMRGQIQARNTKPYMTKIVTSDEDLLEHAALGWEAMQVLGENRTLMRIKNT